MASMNTSSKVSIIGAGTSVFSSHVTMCKVDLLMLEVTGHLVNSLQPANTMTKSSPGYITNHLIQFLQVYDHKITATKSNIIHAARYSNMLVEILITPRKRTFREKPTVPQSIKKLPELCGTRSFTITFTTAHHLSLT